MVPLAYKIATEASEFEAIHRLNYDTFVEEIPQHGANPERRLVDRFHAQNTYVICLDGPRMAGMVCGRCARPFSLDQKIANLDRYLPAHRKAVEIRLLAIAPAYRKTTAGRSEGRTLCHGGQWQGIGRRSRPRRGVSPWAPGIIGTNTELSRPGELRCGGRCTFHTLVELARSARAVIGPDMLGREVRARAAGIGEAACRTERTWTSAACCRDRRGPRHHHRSIARRCHCQGRGNRTRQTRLPHRSSERVSQTAKLASDLPNG
jgi:hypothetical protein